MLLMLQSALHIIDDDDFRHTTDATNTLCRRLSFASHSSPGACSRLFADGSAPPPPPSSSRPAMQCTTWTLRTGHEEQASGPDTWVTSSSASCLRLCVTAAHADRVQVVDPSLSLSLSLAPNSSLSVVTSLNPTPPKCSSLLSTSYSGNEEAGFLPSTDVQLVIPAFIPNHLFPVVRMAASPDRDRDCQSMSQKSGGDRDQEIMHSSSRSSAGIKGCAQSPMCEKEDCLFRMRFSFDR